jgi:hypothetical protein
LERWRDFFLKYCGRSGRQANICHASFSGDPGAPDHLAPSIDSIQATPFYHSDHDTLDSISLWGIEALTRSYAKIIDDLNKVELGDLAWLAGSVPERQRTTGSSR